MSNQRPITDDVLMDYNEGTLDVAKAREVQESLKHDERLARAYDALCKQEEDLFDLGRSVREMLPSINLVDSIMRVLDLESQPEDALESELSRLGEYLKANLPKIEIAGNISNLLQEEQQEPTTTLEKELTSLGKTLRAKTPSINVVPSIRVAIGAKPYPNSSTIIDYATYKAGRKRTTSLSWGALTAIAASVVVGFTFLIVQIVQPTQTRRFDIAKERVSESRNLKTHPQAVPLPSSESDSLALKQTRSKESLLLSSVPRPPSISEKEKSDEQQDDGFTLDDLLRAKKSSLEGQAEALALLARWGMLDPDEVRRLLKEGKLSPIQLAGLSRFLPTEEAIELLKQALQENPDLLAVRLALAKKLMEDPATYNEAQQQLALLREQAPDNALIHYLEARLRLASGDYTGAVALLEYASNFNTGSTYTVYSAQYHSAALQAAGMSAELADTLAAFYAGTEEYGFLTQLRTDLMHYGAYLESSGDYEAAFDIYKSVLLLGQQITNGASYLYEYLAGLDTQSAALEAIDALATLIQIPGGLQTLQIASEILAEGFNAFLEYTDLFEGILGINNVAQLVQVINMILQTGDINYLQNLTM